VVCSNGENVLWRLKLTESPTTRDELRVVSYGGPAVLEKRHFYLDSKSGEWRHGKVRGLTGLDLGTALNVLDEFWERLSEGWKSADTPEAIPAQNQEQEEEIRRIDS